MKWKTLTLESLSPCSGNSSKTCIRWSLVCQTHQVLIPKSLFSHGKQSLQCEHTDITSWLIPPCCFWPSKHPRLQLKQITFEFCLYSVLKLRLASCPAIHNIQCVCSVYFTVFYIDLQMMRTLTFLTWSVSPQSNSISHGVHIWLFHCKNWRSNQM